MIYPKSHILSKSTFMYGCQCPKRLFLHKFKPALRNEEDQVQQRVFDSGTDVGKLAQRLFPGGIDATPPDSYSYHLAVEMTTRFMAQGEQVIYEAAFVYDGVLCAMDILVKKGNGWHAFEVKSTKSVKPQHVQDASLQFYVLTHCGVPVDDMSIVHLNGEYVRDGQLDVQQLFTMESVLKDVREHQPFIQPKIDELKAVLAQPETPIIDIGAHCFVPYKCDFTNHCWAHIPKENSVFDLVRSGGFKAYAAGYKHLDEIPESFELSPTQATQLKHYRSGEVYINRDAIRDFLGHLSYPLYFFDFETVMPAVPEFENTSPYDQVPFQFSLHVQRSPASELEHYSFLGDGVTDPREGLMQHMLQHLGTNGSIVCYNMTFEKNRIKDLAQVFPQFKTELKAIHERIIDLMTPFSKKWYYHKAFKGSYSIKAVLPALVPALSYNDLGIADGGTASFTYSQLKFQDKETIELQRHQLLKYCELDTMAMVEILNLLNHL